MKPRATSRCVRVGDVLVLEACPRAMPEPDSDESIESHREQRDRMTPVTTAETDERKGESGELDYEGLVLVHEP